MKFIVNIIFLLCCLFSIPALAHEESAKLYTAIWIEEKLFKVNKKDIENIVKYAFYNSSKHMIDPFLILSIIEHESSFNKKALNKSAKGLMQVIPYWHKDKIANRDILNIATNIEVGTKILKDCNEKTNGNITSTLNCYRGVNDKKYVAKILKTRKELKQWVIENQFQLQLPIYYASLSDTNIIQ
jgi:soluble lytic murein transglycosylase-like protein